MDVAEDVPDDDQDEHTEKYKMGMDGLHRFVKALSPDLVLEFDYEFSMGYQKYDECRRFQAILIATMVIVEANSTVSIDF